MKVHPITSHELWAAQSALAVAIVLQVVVWAINKELTYGPHNLIVVTEITLAIIIGFTARKRHVQAKSLYRVLSTGLLALISVANITSFFLVARLLITNGQGLSGRELLVAAVAIFLTNIIVFALWYWEIDSPGLTGSKWSKHDKDFQFTQQDMSDDFANWQPGFIDYLYLSTTNGINFAPADTKPITHQAKLLMGIQALVSVFTLALVLARSINILG
ncbi:DUF1345 domain-containing protein [Candidatus Saccharibacteria bacterium]|nr:DUF1345 domain-containing protein [Candidatus Saccharibacteria bacterium]MBI3337998.1 DUF1345 domain-containing protein [Candidatus Saccharibacteria bacterium]